MHQAMQNAQCMYPCALAMILHIIACSQKWMNNRPLIQRLTDIKGQAF